MLGCMSEHPLDRFAARHLGKLMLLGLLSLPPWLVCLVIMYGELASEGRYRLLAVFAASTIGLLIGVAAHLQFLQTERREETD